MDAIYWGPKWSEPDDQEFFSRLSKALEGDSWVLDGNYSRALTIKWQRVETVIWLDFKFLRTIYQSVVRAVSRLLSQEELWPGTGNRESFRMLLSRDSIVLYTITSYWRRKPKYLGYPKSGEYPQIYFIRLRSPREVEEFLQRTAAEQGQNLVKSG